MDLATLAALTWDPQIRGALFTLIAVAILCGSVYLLLATNLGAKVGFLVAAAGLTGWMAVMAVMWAIFGIGLKGAEPHWKVEEIITGDIQQSTIDEVENFPDGWEELKAGDAIFGDAQAAADAVLAPGAEAAHEGEEGAAPTQEESFPPVFDQLEDYTAIGGYRTGGDNYFIPGGLLVVNSGPMEGWLHKPHYTVVQVKPVLPEPEIGGAPPTPAPDPVGETTSVIMVRDLGAKRQPAIIMAASMTLLFGIITYVLHQRDKEIARVRAEAGTTSS
jgi:hypothetical protein